MEGERISAGEFHRTTDLTNPQMRILEAARVIRPKKTSAGWRSYSQADVDAALAWKAKQAALKDARLADRKARQRKD